jgi:LysM repeat protein
LFNAIASKVKTLGGSEGESARVEPRVSPSEPPTRKASKVTTLREKKRAPKPTYYEVRPGDSLSRIGYRHGITVKELCLMNKITPDAVIHPGQKLIVKTAGK